MKRCFGKGLPLLFFLAVSINGLGGTFDTLRSLSPEIRSVQAREIYKKNFRNADSVTAFNGLLELENFAKSIPDKSLEIYVNILRADYLSIRKGLNDWSRDYHQNTIDLSNRHGLLADAAINTQRLAAYYNTHKDYVSAYRYFLEAQQLFEDIGFENVPDVDSKMHEFAIFYYRHGDYQSAQNILLKAINYDSVGSRERIQMFNTLALTFHRQSVYDEALRYYADALSLSENIGDTAWIGIVSGNIGTVYLLQGKYDLSRALLWKDYQLSMRFKDEWTAVGSVLRLAQSNIYLGNLKEAASHIVLAEEIIDRVNDLERYILYYETKVLWFEVNKEAEQAFPYLKKLESAKDSLNKIKNEKAVDRVKLDWEMEKYQANMSQVKADTAMALLRRNTFIGMLFLIIVIILLFHNRQKLKQKQEREAFEANEAILKLEKKNAEEELQNATAALANYTENLKDKNDLIEEFKTEIEKLHSQLNQPFDAEKLRHLENMMSAHIMTNDKWDEFKRLFEKVHSGFFFRLRERFPGISDSDTRLLSLMRLGLQNREMCNMLGVSLEAVKKAKQRLRKKIDLPEENDLNEIVSSI